MIAKLLNKKGFTLIELLVVIVLIAIISLVTFVNFGNQAPKGRNTMRINNLGDLQTAIEFQKADNQLSSVTGVASGGVALTAPRAIINSKYLAKIPNDPQNDTGGTARSYRYGTNALSNAGSYQLAASLEALTDSPTSLGTYNLNTARAAVVGTYIPALTTIDGTGLVMAQVSVTATGATGVADDSKYGLILAKSATGMVATASGATFTEVIVDNGSALPY